jgi:putative polymerase
MLSGFQRLVLLGGTALLIIGCDGRLAAVACVIIFFASLFAARLPAYASMIIAPAALLAALAAVSLLDLRAGSDDFAGRIAHTVQLLRSYGLPEFMGVSDLYLSRAVDSGLAYLITTQSILGALLIWVTFVLATEERSRQEVVFKTAVALYIALSMLVSFSFLSIKTAALLWFVLGAMQPGQSRLPALIARWRRPVPLIPERQARWLKS